MQDDDDAILPTKPPPCGISERLFKLSGGIGWIDDGHGNPVLVVKRAWSFRTPIPKYTSEGMPLGR